MKRGTKGKPWFRVHAEITRNRKVQTLPAELFKWLINLWAAACENGGTIPDAVELAWTFRCSVESVEDVLDELARAGFVDENDGSLAPHDWSEWQFESDVSTDRVKRFRERNGNVSATEHETFHETDVNADQKRGRNVSGTVPDTDTDADAEQRAEARVARPATAHGSRFSLETIPSEWIAWCLSDLNWDEQQAQTVFLSFADYWKAKPGAGGRKADWPATWRNWCRREGQTNGSGGQKPAPAKFWVDPFGHLEDKLSPKQAAINREWEALANK